VTGSDHTMTSQVAPDAQAPAAPSMERPVNGPAASSETQNFRAMGMKHSSQAA
jgi:hypothetical protein